MVRSKGLVIQSLASCGVYVLRAVGHAMQIWEEQTGIWIVMMADNGSDAK